MKEKEKQQQFKIKSVSARELYLYLQSKDIKLKCKNVVLPDSLLLRQMKKLNIENADIMQVKFDYAVKDVIDKSKLLNFPTSITVENA